MHPSGYAPIRLCTHQAMHPSGYAPIRLCTHQAMHPSGYAPIRLCTHLVMHPSGYAPIRLCTHQVMHPSGYAPSVQFCKAGHSLCTKPHHYILKNGTTQLPVTKFFYTPSPVRDLCSIHNSIKVSNLLTLSFAWVSCCIMCWCLP